MKGTLYGIGASHFKSAPPDKRGRCDRASRGGTKGNSSI